jgi:hypothetical protein
MKHILFFFNVRATCSGYAEKPVGNTACSEQPDMLLVGNNIIDLLLEMVDEGIIKGLEILQIGVED